MSDEINEVTFRLELNIEFLSAKRLQNVGGSGANMKHRCKNNFRVKQSRIALPVTVFQTSVEDNLNSCPIGPFTDF